MPRNARLIGIALGGPLLSALSARDLGDLGFLLRPVRHTN
jgi:hypothetical protein